jgi:hypothetical protein
MLLEIVHNDIKSLFQERERQSAQQSLLSRDIELVQAIVSQIRSKNAERTLTQVIDALT